MASSKKRTKKKRPDKMRDELLHNIIALVGSCSDVLKKQRAVSGSDYCYPRCTIDSVEQALSWASGIARTLHDDPSSLNADQLQETLDCCLRFLDDLNTLSITTNKHKN